MDAVVVRLQRERAMSMPMELTFPETVGADLLSAIFTALFVTIGAGILVVRFQSREDERRAARENQRADDLRKADQARADALLKAEARQAVAQRRLAEEHDTRRQVAEHEFQSRSALRESYARLLVAQRRSRQASLDLAAARDESRDELASAAKDAHDRFIDEYHRLALDADRSMWLELRGLRSVLDDMLAHADKGESRACEGLVKSARATRQNLERSFRARLGYEPLQERKATGGYDKA